MELGCSRDYRIIYAHSISIWGGGASQVPPGAALPHADLHRLEQHGFQKAPNAEAYEKNWLGPQLPERSDIRVIRLLWVVDHRDLLIFVIQRRTGAGAADEGNLLAGGGVEADARSEPVTGAAVRLI
jgi:hypothetical protein